MKVRQEVPVNALLRSEKENYTGLNWDHNQAFTNRGALTSGAESEAILHSVSHIINIIFFPAAILFLTGQPKSIHRDSFRVK